jgi:hypothetical protein
MISSFHELTGSVPAPIAAKKGSTTRVWNGPWNKSGKGVRTTVMAQIRPTTGNRRVSFRQPEKVSIWTANPFMTKYIMGPP